MFTKYADSAKNQKQDEVSEMVFSVLAYRLPVEKWKPIWFLSSLGSGGLAVSFYMFFMYRIAPWKYSRVIDGATKMVAAPVTTLEAIKNAWRTGDGGDRFLIVANYLFIYLLFLKHVHLLVWNLIYLARWWRTPAHNRAQRKNEDINMMAVPLSLAMTLNAGFSVSVISIPGMWNHVEKVFPVSVVFLFLIGLLGLSIFVNYMGGFFVEGGFACDKNSHLGQMLAVFAFSMVAVGFAGPMAMTYNHTTYAFALMGTMFFGGIAALFFLPIFTMGMRMMLISGITHEAAASVAVVIPILTLWGITLVRLRAGFNESLKAGIGLWVNLLSLSVTVALELFFVTLGAYVLIRIKYFGRFVWPGGDGWTPLVYSIVCPGVALTVLGQFWIHKGLMAVGLLKYNAPMFWFLLALVSLTLLAVVVMAEMIDFKMFVREPPSTNLAMGPREAQLEQVVPPKPADDAGSQLVVNIIDPKN
eukprot:m51a1_g9296 hypothetical protein (472) ;mRNA; f:49443-51990